MCVCCEIFQRQSGFDCIDTSGDSRFSGKPIINNWTSGDGSDGSSADAGTGGGASGGGALSNAELTTRIEALLQANDFSLANWSSFSGPAVTLTYKFETSAPGDDLWGGDIGGYVAWTEAQKAAMRDVLAEFATVINVNFVEDPTTTDAELSFIRAGDLYVNNVSTNGSGGRGRWQYRNGDEWDGAVALRDNRAIESANDRDLLLHEVGHALGLKHPGNYDVGGNNPPGPFLPLSEDSDRYTVMSYNNNPVTGIESRHLMLYDIAALQSWWGANMSHRTGNDVYSGPGDGRVQVIWDAGGIDTFQAAADTNVVIDLRAGSFSSIGATDNLAIAYGVTIEHGVGAGGADTLTGNEASNTLYGNAGNDTLDGQSGTDTMIGGMGDDGFVVENSGDMVVELVSEGSDTVYTTVTYNVPVNVEVLIMSGSANINSTGTADRDIIIGNDGENIINGAGGFDVMQGGAGNDTYAVDNSSDAVIEMAGEGFDNVYSSVDYIIDAAQEIESAILTGSAVVLRGDDSDNQLFGNDQVNVIDGRGGTDFMLGLGGADIFQINLEAGAQDVIGDFSKAEGDRMAFTGFNQATTFVNQASATSFEVRDTKGTMNDLSDDTVQTFILNDSYSSGTYTQGSLVFGVDYYFG